jgi:cell division protein FtsZ
VLRQGIQGISDLITEPGLINLDFADVKAIMQMAGSALMAIGRGTGDSRCIDAARQAIESPLLEISIEGAKGVLFNVTGGPDLGMLEVHEAASVIQQAADPDANIIFGAVIDQEMGADVKITIIATGFDSARRQVEMRPAYAQRDVPVHNPIYQPPQQSQQSLQQSQPLQPSTLESDNGQSQPYTPLAQPARAADQPTARPSSSSRPVQPQSGDELDIPPFLYPKYKR